MSQPFVHVGRHLHKSHLCAAILGFTAALFVGPAAHADMATLGVLSFSTLIPSAPGSPGVNDFEIDNFTGAFSLPPDFPATDPLTFLNSSIVLTFQGGSEQIVNLGDLGPASYTPASLQFSAATEFTSAVFSGTLSPTAFSLFDGSTFNTVNSLLSVSLPSSPEPVLSPDTDFSFITVSNTAASVPEPATATLLLGGFAAVFWLCKRHRIA